MKILGLLGLNRINDELISPPQSSEEKKLVNVSIDIEPPGNLTNFQLRLTARDGEETLLEKLTDTATFPSDIPRLKDDVLRFLEALPEIYTFNLEEVEATLKEIQRTVASQRKEFHAEMKRGKGWGHIFTRLFNGYGLPR